MQSGLLLPADGGYPLKPVAVGRLRLRAGFPLSSGATPLPPRATTGVRRRYPTTHRVESAREQDTEKLCSYHCPINLTIKICCLADLSIVFYLTARLKWQEPGWPVEKSGCVKAQELPRILVILTFITSDGITDTVDGSQALPSAQFVKRVLRCRVRSCHQWSGKGDRVVGPQSHLSQ